MIRFREFQPATTIFAIAIPFQILLGLLFVFKAGNHPLSAGSFAMANGIFLLIYLLFFGMRTTLDEETIRITYGIGLIRKKIKLTDIKDVAVVSSPWYVGWGIRLIPNGVMYNINGPGAVELSFRNKFQVIRIGSANASLLQEKIRAFLNVKSAEAI